MIVCECKDIETLDPFIKKRIQEVPLPHYTEVYLGSPAETKEQKLCFTASVDQKLAGFVLITYSYGLNLANIIQFFIEKEFDPKIIAPPLILYIEEFLKERDCLIVQCLYEREVGKPAPWIEEILYSQGFGLKTECLLLYFFDSYVFHPPWFEAEYPLPPKFSFLLWKDVPLSEIEKLGFAEERHTIHHSISPTSESSIIQPINSVALMYEDKVVGWMITHTPIEESDYIRYSSLYIEPEFRTRGVAVPLLQKSILLQQQSPIRLANFTINLEFSEKRWLRFIDKRLSSSAFRTLKIYRLSKPLY